MGILSFFLLFMFIIATIAILFIVVKFLSFVHKISKFTGIDPMAVSIDYAKGKDEILSSYMSLIQIVKTDYPDDADSMEGMLKRNWRYMPSLCAENNGICMRAYWIHDKKELALTGKHGKYELKKGNFDMINSYDCTTELIIPYAGNPVVVSTGIARLD